MNDRAIRRYDTFGRIITFVQENKADFAAGGEALKRLANLTKVRGDLDAAKAGQTGGSATPKAVLLDGLTLDLGNIHRTATAVDQDEPGFSADFPLAGNSEEALLKTATAYLLKLQPADADAPAETAARTALAARFIAHELPAGFVDDLQSDVDEIAEANRQLASGNLSGVENTAAVNQLIRDGMKQVRYLDAIMHNKYSRQPVKMRGWQSASHIERAPVREKRAIKATGGETAAQG